MGLAMALAAVGCGPAETSLESADYGTDSAAQVDSDIKPNGRGIGLHKQWTGEAGPNGQAKRTTGGGTGNGISYHGGPVMTSTTNVYFIWYGNWSGNTATSILTNLASSIGGSPRFNTNTSYYNGSNVKVVNSVTLAGTTTDNYSYGTALTDANIQSIVASAITSGRLPSDANGFYVVLTSADVNATSGFCTNYCGWHTYASIGGKAIKYSFVGNADRCLSSCSSGYTSPNGNRGADAMASVFVHELEETVTDPQLNAWYDSNGYENSDKCAWSWGTTYTTANGGKANMKLGTMDYLIQRNWVNASGGYCSLSY